MDLLAVVYTKEVSVICEVSCGVICYMCKPLALVIDSDSSGRSVELTLDALVTRFCE